MIEKQSALEYHSQGRPGKIEIRITKPFRTQRHLALAYTPGVAEPCLAIRDHAEAVYDYTAKGNLVAVVSNGSAVLGLGNIGPAAGKPVMEGKAALFKRFADIDVFDLELDTADPDEIIRTVQILAPTFGGINLEDIKAPECFYVESRLRELLRIPVFHDDQHGTAIISGAALLNAVELAGKQLAEIKVVINGAGAAGIACAKFYLTLGVRRENLILCDSRGVIYRGRESGMNKYKVELAAETEARTLAEALVGADVFVGVSIADIVTPEMVQSMAERPIVFAMANPVPEIRYEAAVAARPDVIMATGRSDYPNQVNNVLGFPFIFRGALDVRATSIHESMKIAAARALAALAREPVPYSVIKAYRLEHLEFGREYLIPKPFDPRVLTWVAPAVAQAAIESGVARLHIDIDAYREALEARFGKSREVMRVMFNKARRAPKRIVYPEGDHPAILKACEIILDECIALPILLGDPKTIRAGIEALRLDILPGVEIIDPVKSPKFERYVERFYSMRQRKGITRSDAQRLIRQNIYFGAMMVAENDADGLLAGLTRAYPDTIRPALQVIGMREGVSKVAGFYMLTLGDQVLFFGDTTVNIEPTAEELAEITLLCAREARRFDVEPRIALLSFSNFGSARHPASEKVRQAVEIVKMRDPQLIVDGEMQADTAVVPELLDEVYPFSALAGKGPANVLIFPNLAAGNIAYKLMQRLCGAEAIGPILLGMRKPVHLLQIGDYDEIDVVNMTAIAVVDGQQSSDSGKERMKR